uniref:Uncharacterized protein n=1 Tax=Physcomitrium patens TaxID=3218 RepID=A0A2K1JE26_PHYPA|nr:hypothetical protein PHYPA_020056 [Physcomitrium patens]
MNKKGMKLLTNEDQKYMEKILYVLAIRSFMYDMICIKSNIKHTVGVFVNIEKLRLYKASIGFYNY